MREKVKKIENYNIKDKMFQEKVRLLKEYIKEHDGKFPGVREGTLGKWLYEQQKSYRNGKLSKERIETLDGLGNWIISYSYEDRWNDQFNDLREFVSENKRFPKSNEGSIGKWLHDQELLLRNDKLNLKRKEQLDSLGNWIINLSYDEKWNIRFKELQEFISENKRFPKQNENDIGTWIHNQKTFLKKGKLKPERKVLLDSLGDWTNTLKAKSNDGKGFKKTKLSKSDVIEKFKKYYETNDKSIRNEIIIENLGLVWKVINNMNLNSIQPDFLQAGYLGLINAVDNYDINKGAFSTFAFKYIDGYIRKERYFLSGVPASYATLYIYLRSVENEYNETILDNPSLVKVVVDRLISSGVISKKSYNETVRKVLLLRTCSLEETMETKDNQIFYNLGYEVDDNDINESYDNELCNIIRQEISKLKKQKQLILELSFGLNNDKEYNQQEIANVLGVTHQAVSLNMNSTIEKMSENEKVKVLKYYLHREVK